MRGLVIKSTGSFYQVKVEGDVFECRVKGKLRMKGLVTTNPVSVGDWVQFEMESHGRGMITEVEERKNYIIRKSTNLSKQAHIVAANIDTAYLVVTLVAPQTSFGFIDRFLVSCEAYEIPAVLVFNKMDQYADESLPVLEKIIAMYDNIGYPSIKTSVVSNMNLEELEISMKGRVSLLSGHSGVGKSSLLNAIYPGLNVRVGDISDSHQKGQHTTTFAEMFELPFGGYLVDTPGIKGFGLIDIEKEELAMYFPEMRERLPHCKYYNCQHVSEPGCAVKKGLEEGTIAETRYQSYLGMMDDGEGPYR
jgi:ribosome biogenesis GTPase